MDHFVRVVRRCECTVAEKAEAEAVATFTSSVKVDSGEVDDGEGEDMRRRLRGGGITPSLIDKSAS